MSIEGMVVQGTEFGIAKYQTALREDGYSLNAVKDIQKDFEGKYGLERQDKDKQFCTMGFLLRDMKLTKEKQSEMLVEYMGYLFPKERS